MMRIEQLLEKLSPPVVRMTVDITAVISSPAGSYYNLSVTAALIVKWSCLRERQLLTERH